MKGPLKRMMAVLVLGLLPWGARAEDDLTQDQIAAYVAVVKADLARDAGSVAEARRLYLEAQELYEAIAKKNARWHPEIVQFRLSYCKSQLEALRDRPEGERPAPNAAAAASAPDTATAEALERLTRLETENAELKTMRQALEHELAALSNRVAEAMAEVDRLGAERDALRQQLADAEAALQAASRDEEADAQLRRERDALQDALQAAAKALDDQTRLAEVTREEAAREIQGLREAQAELERQLAEARAQTAQSIDEEKPAPADPDAVQRELARLRQTIDEAAAQLDASREAAVNLLKAAQRPAQP